MSEFTQATLVWEKRNTLEVLIQRADLWMVVDYPKMLLPGSLLMDVQAGGIQIISHIPTINYYTFLVPVGNGHRACGREELQFLTLLDSISQLLQQSTAEFRAQD